MLKRRMSIIAMAILLCTVTACSQGQNNNNSSASETSVSQKISVNDNNEISTEESSSGQSEAKESDDTEVSDNVNNTQNETNSTQTETTKNNVKASDTDATSDISSSVKTTVSAGELSADDIFSNRDLAQTADTSSAKSITVTSGQTINITEEGVYVLSGTATNCTVRVEAGNEAKVQLVLDGVDITNDSAPAIYVVSADKCFITSTGSNSLSVTGTFTSDGDTNTDAVIFSKDDIVLNGTGSLTINSSQGNGISGKDDVKITGGTYNITSAVMESNALDYKVFAVYYPMYAYYNYNTRRSFRRMDSYAEQIFKDKAAAKKHYDIMLNLFN